MPQVLVVPAVNYVLIMELKIKYGHSTRNLNPDSPDKVYSMQDYESIDGSGYGSGNGDGIGDGYGDDLGDSGDFGGFGNGGGDYHGNGND